MGVGIYYFYHGFGLQAFEGRHIRILFYAQCQLQSSYDLLILVSHEGCELL
jgi:hypothetical protein